MAKPTFKQITLVLTVQSKDARQIGTTLNAVLDLIATEQFVGDDHIVISNAKATKPDSFDDWNMK